MSSQGITQTKVFAKQMRYIALLLASIKTLGTDLTTNLRRGDFEAATVTAAAISGRVLTVGQAILVAVIMLIVLGELYATDIVANPTNPNEFTNMTSTFASYGTTAFTMIGLGLIAAGASAALAYFGLFNTGGR